MARKERGFCGFCQVYESLHIHSPEVRAALNAEGTGYRHAKELGGIIFDLRRQLQRAIGRGIEWWGYLDYAQDEYKAAIKRGSSVTWYLCGVLKGAVWLAAEAKAAEALAEKYGGALEQFSLWLEQECKRGTLDLGFGPDWSAIKVQLALDRLLTPAEALRAEHRSSQSGQEEGDGD